ncbi:MAG: Holliday junction resolvase RuvX [Flavobacteriaceae bacterium]|nr:Holliday junction resolvase RuvX [Flavobacteriaceae bacterium]
MARVMALDFGYKRTGIAVTDDFQLIASGLTTVDTAQLMPFIKTYTESENVALVLIGLPKQMNNTLSDAAPGVLEFVKAFRENFPTLPIETVDERFTSKMAMQSLHTQGAKKKQKHNKALLDEISATLLLQDYLNRKS